MTGPAPMTLRRIAVLLVLLALAPGVRADSALFDPPPAALSRVQIHLAQPIEALRDSTVVRGRFTQLKHLSGFPQPLKSSGEFLFVRGLGVVWHTLEPFESRFVLDAVGIREQGQAAPAAGPDSDAGAAPALQMVSTVFLALFNLDLEALAAQFDLYSLPTAAGWTLGLRPRDPSVAAMADRITLRGQRRIEHIELSDGRGDVTAIQLHEVEISQVEATADQRARFAP